MADYPALPLWTDAFIADTTHMDCLESGAYLLLLIAAWRTPDCALPDDDKQLARMARCSPKEWKKVREGVMALWTKDPETQKWTQKRLKKERSYVHERSQKAKRAAKAKWAKNNKTDNADAGPEDMPGEAGAAAPIPIPIPNKKESIYAFEGKVVRLTPKDFAQWAKSYTRNDQALLTALLQSRDDYLSSEDATDADRKRWFMSTSNWLSNKRGSAKREALAESGRERTAGDGISVEQLAREKLI